MAPPWEALVENPLHMMEVGLVSSMLQCWLLWRIYARGILDWEDALYQRHLPQRRNHLDTTNGAGPVRFPASSKPAHFCAGEMMHIPTL